MTDSIYDVSGSLTTTARVGKLLTRIILFLALAGVLTDAADNGLPFWLGLLLAVFVVVPLIRWPTLGVCVVASYLVIRLVTSL